jgi:hypothetical protein
MYSRECHFRAEDFQAGTSNRDAVDGFSAIAAALDNGLDERAINGDKIADMMAILLGWALLAAVIFYPALQLAAIAVCVVFFCMRPFIRYVFRQVATIVEWSPGMLPRDNRSLARV